MRTLMIVLITINLWSSPLAALSQSAGGTDDLHGRDTKAWVGGFLRHLCLEDKSTPQDVEQSAQGVLRIGKSKVPIKIEATERANRS